MTIAERLAEYVHSVDYADIDEATRHNAKKIIIDTIGCAIGAFNEKPIKIARATIRDAKSEPFSTILGTRRKTDPSLAAFINGGMARYFDYNDTYDAKEFAHPSDNILPIFAVVEAAHKGGRDAILGTVLAYELQARLADAASLWRHGWDHVIYGLVSVSAAASRIMDLSVEQTTQAINIALNSHLVMRQLRSGEISMWKAFAFSNSARNAIFSAMLAKNGMTGPSPVFEGEMGFWKQVTGKFEIDTRKFGSRRNKFRINLSVLKYFPAEIRAQTAIFAALELRSRFKSIKDIKSVKIGVDEASYKIIGKGPEKWDPKTKETADHSLPFVVAAALMDGNVGTSTYLKKRFRDKNTLEFMKRITVNEVPRYTKLFNKGGTVNASSITIKLNNGKVLHSESIYSKGHHKNPMSDSEIEEKFKRLTKRYLNDEKSKLLLDSLWHLDNINQVSSLFTMVGEL